MHLLAIGDWGAPPEDTDDYKKLRSMQQKIARAMAAYSVEQGIGLSAVLALGDNFYHALRGTDDPRWQWGFENLFTKANFACPFYAVMGNHDYEDGKQENWKHEIAYANDNPQGRWHFPATNGATWYRQDFSQGDKKLLTILFLDSNTDHMHLADGWNKQVEWIKSELDKSDHGRWLVIAAHHPMFTEGYHHSGKEDPDLYPKIRKDWLPKFSSAVFYVSGHDHNLQHIQHPDWNHLDFLISGAGGGDFPQKQEGFDAGWKTAFFKKFGFIHLAFTSTQAKARLVSVDKAGQHTTEHEVSRS